MLRSCLKQMRNTKLVELLDKDVKTNFYKHISLELLAVGMLSRRLKSSYSLLTHPDAASSLSGVTFIESWFLTNVEMLSPFKKARQADR